MIDIHEKIGKLPIFPKRGFTLPNMHFCGPYNPLEKQLIYDQKGKILRYIQKPTGKTDMICSQHDVDYTLAKNLKDKHIADKEMIDSILLKRVIIKSLQCHLKLKKMKTELLHLANF